MARRTRPKSQKSRKTQDTRIYATRRHIEAVLAIIEQNSNRIDRLEDVFAMHAKERGQVQKEIGAIRGLLLNKRPKRRRR
jgi:Mg2+ and Co2+ transporter CorA